MNLLKITLPKQAVEGESKNKTFWGAGDILLDLLISNLIIHKVHC